MLAATRSVTRACQAVGKSAVTAYALRKRPDAKSFAAAWNAAVAFVPDAGRQRSSRFARRLARFAARRPKANEVSEKYDPPRSPPAPAKALSALQDLEALLARLDHRRICRN